jgi:hypothetical protein
MAKRASCCQTKAVKPKRTPAMKPDDPGAPDRSRNGGV